MILNTTIRTVGCDAEGCDKNVMFDVKDEKTVFENPENAWLKTTRVVNTLDQRAVVYCSDICEVQAVGTGAHNLPEPKRIVEAASNPASVALAAEAAKRVSEATTALKAGSGVTLHQG